MCLQISLMCPPQHWPPAPWGRPPCPETARHLMTAPPCAWAAKLANCAEAPSRSWCSLLLPDRGLNTYQAVLSMAGSIECVGVRLSALCTALWWQWLPTASAMPPFAVSSGVSFSRSNSCTSALHEAPHIGSECTAAHLHLMPCYVMSKHHASPRWTHR